MKRRDFFRAACACATTAVVGPEVVAPLVRAVPTHLVMTQRLEEALRDYYSPDCKLIPYEEYRTRRNARIKAEPVSQPCGGSVRRASLAVMVWACTRPES